MSEIEETNKDEILKEETKQPSFTEELCTLINKHGLDSKLKIQDYVLASYIMQTIQLIEQIDKNKAFFNNLLGSQIFRLK